jgi:hypothetical protein
LSADVDKSHMAIVVKRVDKRVFLFSATEIRYSQWNVIFLKLRNAGKHSLKPKVLLRYLELLSFGIIYCRIYCPVKPLYSPWSLVEVLEKTVKYPEVGALSNVVWRKNLSVAAATTGTSYCPETMPFALRVCPFSVVVFFATAAFVTVTHRKRSGKRLLASDRDANEQQPVVKVVFVLGAPGAG